MNWNKVAGKLLERAIELKEQSLQIAAAEGEPGLEIARDLTIVSYILTYLSEALREGANNGD